MENNKYLDKVVGSLVRSTKLDYDREDDWWTDRKGGYDVTIKYEEETK